MFWRTWQVDNIMLQHFSVETPVEQIANAVEQDGACIVDSLISEELCDGLMSDFMPYIDGSKWCNAEDEGDPENEFFGFKTKRFHGLPSMSGRCADVICHPFLLQLAYHVLEGGKRCRDVRVSTMELMVLGKGEVQQRFHRDFDSWPYVDRANEKALLISANIAMCDFTETNGATVVVPGSHRWEKGREPEQGEWCQALMSKGSALTYSGDVIHGGGSNTEEDIRTGFYIGYVPSWLATLENHLLSNSPEVVHGMNEKSRHLLGVNSSGFQVIP